MKHVYVVRHCKAEGQEPDAKLTEPGIQQAENLAEFLLDKDIESIVSSPFERAFRTIAPLAEQIGVEVVLDDRLAERILSSKNHPDWRDMLRKTYDDLDLRYEGGESSSTAMGRAISVVMEVLNSEYKNIVFVSHGNLISLLLKHFDDRIGFKEWESLSNPDVFHLSFSENKPSIRRIWAPH
ncbi:histidine phosphatase family protein [Paenibacillus sp. N4]|uniref:histidine phosphatase family protein n=1 Tax=Paenibacillus vietnamensis TaxID=2590547 RepID=UPI001CD12CE1|nr:histidine phosphatase family protein [Paenibacillus vietnamensis]MCA0757877.1 histidine phosphatase family protein [Paenibacillus vietnamensis]